MFDILTDMSISTTEISDVLTDILIKLNFQLRFGRTVNGEIGNLMYGSYKSSRVKSLKWLIVCFAQTHSMLSEVE